MNAVFNRNYGKWFLNDILHTIEKFNLVHDGEKICVALSGGKDSMTLLWIMNYIRSFTRFRFDLSAVHIRIRDDYDTTALKDYCHDMDVAYFEEKLQYRGEIPRKSFCYLCSRLKRGAIRQVLLKNGIQKVAYGHHAGDVAETWFMNLFGQGRAETFCPLVRTQDSNLVIIRPLYFTEEKKLTTLHRIHHLPVLQFHCDQGDCNIRSDYRKFLGDVEENFGSGVLRNIMKGISREIQRD